jgi:hypothetical protein
LAQGVQAVGLHRTLKQGVRGSGQIKERNVRLLEGKLGKYMAMTVEEGTQLLWDGPETGKGRLCGSLQARAIARPFSSKTFVG